jgi:hypothetical protein
VTLPFYFDKFSISVLTKNFSLIRIAEIVIGRLIFLRRFLVQKLIVLVALAAFCFTAVGCATVTQPVAATTSPVGSKVGHASGKIWLGMFGSADAGIQAAAQNGGITKISTVDFTKKLGILGLWVEYEAIVTGE